MMKKLGAVALCTAVMLMVFVQPVSAAGGHTIAEVRESAPDYWQTGLTVNGEAVSAPVYVPDVGQMPVLRVRAHKFSDEELTAALGGEVCDFTPREDKHSFDVRSTQELDGYTHYRQAIIQNVWQKEWKPVLARLELEPDLWDEGVMPTAENTYAENQTISLAEAIEDVQKRFEKLYSNIDGGFFLENVEVLSPSLDEKDEIDEVGKLTGVGGYHIDGVEMLHGVPILDRINRAFQNSSNDSLYMIVASTNAHNYVADYRATDHFTAIGIPWKETEMLAEDIPLCSLDDVIAAMQPMIDSGRMKYIYDLRLGYVAYADREIKYNDKDTWRESVIRLVPTWICRCSYVKDPNRDYSNVPESESHEANAPWSLDWHRAIFMINAQTGKLINDHEMGLDDLYAPQLLTWDDVK